MSAMFEGTADLDEWLEVRVDVVVFCCDDEQRELSERELAYLGAARMATGLAVVVVGRSLGEGPIVDSLGERFDVVHDDDAVDTLVRETYARDPAYLGRVFERLLPGSVEQIGPDYLVLADAVVRVKPSAEDGAHATSFEELTRRFQRPLLLLTERFEMPDRAALAARAIQSGTIDELWTAYVDCVLQRHGARVMQHGIPETAAWPSPLDVVVRHIDAPVARPWDAALVSVLADSLFRAVVVVAPGCAGQIAVPEENLALVRRREDVDVIVEQWRGELFHVYQYLGSLLGPGGYAEINDERSVLLVDVPSLDGGSVDHIAVVPFDASLDSEVMLARIDVVSVVEGVDAVVLYGSGANAPPPELVERLLTGESTRATASSLGELEARVLNVAARTAQQERLKAVWRDVRLETDERTGCHVYRCRLDQDMLSPLERKLIGELAMHAPTLIVEAPGLDDFGMLALWMHVDDVVQRRVHITSSAVETRSIAMRAASELEHVARAIAPDARRIEDLQALALEGVSICMGGSEGTAELKRRIGALVEREQRPVLVVCASAGEAIDVLRVGIAGSDAVAVTDSLGEASILARGIGDAFREAERLNEVRDARESAAPEHAAQVARASTILELARRSFEQGGISDRPVDRATLIRRTAAMLFKRRALHSPLVRIAALLRPSRGNDPARRRP